MSHSLKYESKNLSSRLNIANSPLYKFRIRLRLSKFNKNFESQCHIQLKIEFMVIYFVVITVGSERILILCGL